MSMDRLQNDYAPRRAFRDSNQRTDFNPKQLRALALEMNEVLGPRYHGQPLDIHKIHIVYGIVCQKLRVLGDDTLDLGQRELADSDAATLIRYLSESDAPRSARSGISDDNSFYARASREEDASGDGMEAIERLGREMKLWNMDSPRDFERRDGAFEDESLEHQYERRFRANRAHRNGGTDRERWDKHERGNSRAWP
jgi:hypothetical protein